MQMFLRDRLFIFQAVEKQDFWENTLQNIIKLNYIFSIL